MTQGSSLSSLAFAIVTIVQQHSNAQSIPIAQYHDVPAKWLKADAQKLPFG